MSPKWGTMGYYWQLVGRGQGHSSMSPTRETCPPKCEQNPVKKCRIPRRFLPVCLRLSRWHQDHAAQVDSGISSVIWLGKFFIVYLFLSFGFSSEPLLVADFIFLRPHLLPFHSLSTARPGIAGQWSRAPHKASPAQPVVTLPRGHSVT